MRMLKTFIEVIKGNAVIITLTDRHKLNMVKGKNITNTEAMVMGLKIAETLQ